MKNGTMAGKYEDNEYGDTFVKSGNEVVYAGGSSNLSGAGSGAQGTERDKYSEKNALIQSRQSHLNSSNAYLST